MVKCPQCGHENLEGAAFCDECGASLLNLAPQPATGTAAEPANPAQAGIPAPVNDNAGAPAPAAQAQPVAGGKKCPQCGTENGPNDRFCFNCGAPLVNTDQPAAGQMPAQPQTAAPIAPIAEPQELAPMQAPQTVPQQSIPPVVPPMMSTPATGARLVMPDGSEITLPNKPEILIGREDPVSGIFPEVDMTQHGGEEGGVSRRHVRILNQNGQYSIEDLNSTNFTFVNKQKLSPKMPHPLQNGDEIRLGRVSMTFHTDANGGTPAMP